MESVVVDKTVQPGANPTDLLAWKQATALQGSVEEADPEVIPDLRILVLLAGFTVFFMFARYA